MMNFNDITGQKDVVASLGNSIKNSRVSHSYIFSGPKGIGKRTVAEIFAAALICENKPADGGCGVCGPCRMFAYGSNPDFYKIDIPGPSIGVDDIRCLQDDIIIKPLYSDKKVYLIADSEKMTAQAQNCLLKTLESPPLYAVVILTTSNYDALLGTIRSRAIRYNFRQNLNLASSDEFISLREKTIEMLLKIYSSEISDAFSPYEFFNANKNDIEIIFDVMTLFLRDLLMAKESNKDGILINSDKKDIIFNNAAGLSLRKLVKHLEVVESTRRILKQNINYQLAVEIMLMKLQEDKE